MKSFSFVLNQTECQKDLNFNQLNQLDENIRDALFSTGKYKIQSDVDIQNLKFFLDYFINQIPLPEINIDNMYDFCQLSKEFKISIDQLSTNKLDPNYIFSVLKSVKSDENEDKSSCEEYICQNLDTFLQNHSKEMKILPINSLYNIFYANNRKLRDQKSAYFFITKQEDRKDLFVLLNSLDCSELDDDIIEDSISKKIERFGFSPHFSGDQFKKLIESQKIMESQKSKLSDYEKTIELQKSKISEYEKIIESQKSKLNEFEKSSELQKSKLSEYEKIIESQKSKLNEFEKSSELQKSKLGEYGKTIESQKSKISDYEKSSELQKSKLSECEKTIEFQKSKLNEFEKSSELQKSKLGEYEKTIELQKSKMSEFENTIKSLQKKLNEKQIINAGASVIKEGARVRVKPAAKQYGTSKTFAKSVYNDVFVVKEIKGDRAVIFSDKICIGALNVKDLILP